MRYDGYVNFDARINKDGISKDIAYVKKSLLALTAAFGTFSFFSLKVGSSFEQAMSKVNITLGITAKEVRENTDLVKKLQATAQEWGNKTAYSAREAADAMNYLAQSGMDAETTMKTLPKVLLLAQAANLDLAQSADMVANAMSALGIPISKVTNFTDILAKTSQKSNSNVAELGEAFIKLGSVGRSAAGGTEELAAAFGILGNNGIKAEIAGTALRNIYTRIMGGNKQATQQLERLGIATYDATGNLKPLATIFEELNKKLNKLSNPEQARIITEIFDVFNATSARAILNNVSALKKLESTLKDVDGTTQDAADIIGDTFAQKLDNLKGATEGLSSVLFGEANPALKQAVERLTEFIDTFSKSESAKELGKIIGGLVESLSTLVANTLPTIVSLFKILAPILKLIADNAKIILTTFVAWKALNLASYLKDLTNNFKLLKSGMAGARLMMMKVKTSIKEINFAIMATAIGAAVTALSWLISKTKELNDTKVNKFNEGLEKSFETIMNSKASIEGLTQSAKAGLAQMGKFEDKLNQLRKSDSSSIYVPELDMRLNEDELKSILESYKTGIQGVIDKIKELSKTVNDVPELKGKIQVSEEDFNFSSSVIGGFVTELLGIKDANEGIKKTAGEALGAMTQGFADATEEMGKALAEGTNPLDAFGKMMVDSALQAYSSVADTLIAWGTLATIVNASGGTPPPGYSASMLPMGLAMKVTAGAMKGMLKYADGGVVPGNSKYGDKIIARLNSGEVVLNEKQQKNAWAMMNNSASNVNIQIINNSDAQVSATNDNQGNIKVLIESVVLDTLGNKKGAAVLRNNYNLKKVGV